LFFLVRVFVEEVEDSLGAIIAFVDCDFDGPPIGFLVVDLSTSGSVRAIDN
jgi:hypothetical protein